MKLKIFRKKRVILATIYTGRNFFYIFFVMFVCLFAIGGCTLTDSGTSGLSNKSPGGDGNSIPRADLAVHGGGAYVAISKDLNSQAIYFETGRTAKEAFGAAITECEAFADNRAGCVVIRTYNTVLEPRIDGDPAKEWDCFAREARLNSEDMEDIRSWLASSKTIGDAKKKALALCQAEGGIDCRILRCFNADQDKI